MRRGQVLSFNQPISGLRAYLAVTGCFQAEPVLGSVACVEREGLGGHDGEGHSWGEGDCLAMGVNAGKALHEQEALADVRPDGQPIALLNDRQTIGGYPRLGALTPLACAQLAQRPPGKEVRLKAVSAEQALVDYRHFLAAVR